MERDCSSLDGVCRGDLKKLVKDIRRLAGKADSIYVLVDTKPVKDYVHKQPVVDENNVPVMSCSHPIDVFRMFVKLGGKEYRGPYYLGYGKRIESSEDSTGYRYAQSTLQCLEDELYPRLGEFLDLARALKSSLYFTSDIFSCKEKELNEEDLVHSNKTLGIINS